MRVTKDNGVEVEITPFDTIRIIADVESRSGCFVEEPHITYNVCVDRQPKVSDLDNTDTWWDNTDESWEIVGNFGTVKGASEFIEAIKLELGKEALK